VGGAHSPVSLSVRDADGALPTIYFVPADVFWYVAAQIVCSVPPDGTRPNTQEAHLSAWMCAAPRLPVRCWPRWQGELGADGRDAAFRTGDEVGKDWA
jgi:hypothetical protein